MLLSIYFFGTKVYSQHSEITLLEFIKKIEASYDVSISYNHKLASRTKIYEIPLKDDLNHELKTALSGSGVGFILDNNTINLYPIKKLKKNTKSVSGVVRDQDGGESLPNAVVQVVHNENNYTVSNRDGLFSLLNIPSDTTTIRISYLGYSPIETTVANLKENAEISLQAKPEVLEELVISDDLDVIEIAEKPSQISLNTRYFNNLTSFGQKDAFRSLQLLPGISGTGESSANLRIRGGTPDQNLVLFDGFTVYHLDHFFGVFSAFNTQVIKDIQVFKGGFGSEYGGRVSSVVDMIGKNGNRDKVSGQASVNLLSTNGILEVPVTDKISFMVAGRRSFTDLIRTSLFNDLFNQVNEESEVGRAFEEEEDIEPDFFFYDLNAKASWNISANDILQFSFYRGKDNLRLEQFFEDEGDDFQFEQLLRQDSEWGNQGESIRFAKRWSNRWQSEIRGTHSTFFRNQNQLEETFVLDSADIFEEDFEFRDENKIEEFSLHSSTDYQLNQYNKFTLGGFFSQNTISYKSFFFGDEDFSIKLDGINTGLFFNHATQPASTVSLNTGLRITFYDLTNKSYLEPRISLTYQPLDHLRLKGAFGRYYQFVGRVVTLGNTLGPEDFWLLRGLEDSPVISSNQYIAGATLDLGFLEIDIEGYYKEIDGLSSYTSDSAGGFEEDFDGLTQGSGRVKGMDFLLKRETANITSWISYTISQSTNRFEEIDDNDSFDANFDQRNEVKVVNSYQLKAWNFTGSWVYGSGRPYTPRFVNFDEEEDIPIGGINSERLPNYHRLDLNISYLKQLQKMDLRFSVNFLNIYNRTNVRNIFLLEQFDEEVDEIVTREEFVPMLGFTPSIGIEISF